MIVKLIRFLFFFILFYYLLKLFRNAVNFMSDTLTFKRSPGSPKKPKTRNYGEVTIDYAPKKRKKINADDAEFVEYEEVK